MEQIASFNNRYLFLNNFTHLFEGLLRHLRFNAIENEKSRVQKSQVI